jgi:hypothetical protein
MEATGKIRRDGIKTHILGGTTRWRDYGTKSKKVWFGYVKERMSIEKGYHKDYCK